jgi:hypothetical protein
MKEMVDAYLTRARQRFDAQQNNTTVKLRDPVNGGHQKQASEGGQATMTQSRERRERCISRSLSGTSIVFECMNGSCGRLGASADTNYLCDVCLHTQQLIMANFTNPGSSSFGASSKAGSPPTVHNGSNRHINLSATLPANMHLSPVTIANGGDDKPVVEVSVNAPKATDMPATTHARNGSISMSTKQLMSTVTIDGQKRRQYAKHNGDNVTHYYDVDTITSSSNAVSGGAGKPVDVMEIYECRSALCSNYSNGCGVLCSACQLKR